MPARSVANGDYLTLMYVQSASRSLDWYRVALDRRSRARSCDCPIWTFNRSRDRTCKHTRFVESLLLLQLEHDGHHEHPGARGIGTEADVIDDDDSHPYVQAIAQQFPGFRGHWRVRERIGRIEHDAYRVVQLRFTSGNGDTIEATLAFAEAHHLTEIARRGEIAVRAGYCIGLELAHRRGIVLDVRPPSHYRATAAATRTYLPTRRAGDELPAIAVDHILRVAGVPAAGSTPVDRAEGTLRLMLGDATYAQLLRDGYLDVPSARYANRRRVYRLRRDPARSTDKRVRVFEEAGGRMTYFKDFCIVRTSFSVPEADHFLSKWLGLLSDELSILEVLRTCNIFAPHSDDYGARIEEPTLPVWREPGSTLVA